MDYHPRPNNPIRSRHRAVAPSPPPDARAPPDRRARARSTRKYFPSQLPRASPDSRARRARITASSRRPASRRVASSAHRGLEQFIVVLPRARHARGALGDGRLGGRLRDDLDAGERGSGGEHRVDSRRMRRVRRRARARVESRAATDRPIPRRAVLSSFMITRMTH